MILECYMMLLIWIVHSLHRLAMIIIIIDHMLSSRDQTIAYDLTNAHYIITGFIMFIMWFVHSYTLVIVII